MKHLALKYSWLPLVFLLFSCWKEPNYPREPEIEFKAIESRTFFDEFNKTDKVEVKITLKFKDGDGNLGIDNGNPADSLAPFNFAEGKNKFHHNYFIETLVEENGKFVPLNLNFSFNGRFPLLNPDGKVRPLEGDLVYTIDDFFVYYLPLTFQSGDRMKFRVSIADRALNISNTVETDPVQVFF